MLEMQEMGVQSLGREEPLGKAMGKEEYFGILAWRIPWTARLWSIGSRRVDTMGQLSTHSKGHISREFHSSVLIVVVGTTRRVNMLLVKFPVTFGE